MTRPTKPYNEVKAMLGFEMRDDSLIDDIIRLLQIKRNPNRKVLPNDIEKCGKLDIGFSHEEITKFIS